MQKRRTLEMFGWACLFALLFLCVAAPGAYAAPQAGGYHVIRAYRSAATAAGTISASIPMPTAFTSRAART